MFLAMTLREKCFTMMHEVTVPGKVGCTGGSRDEVTFI